MVLVQAKESKKTSGCARQGCDKTVYQGKPYIWDTDEKKAYCSKECAETATGRKVAEPQQDRSNFSKNTGGFRPVSQQLWRSPEEATAAITIWHQTVVPMIKKTTEESLKIIAKVDADKAGVPEIKFNEQRYDTMLQYWTKTYKEIFLGKMETPVNKQ